MLDAHFQLHVDDNVRAGMTPGDARRAARLTFGPVEAIKDQCRDRASVPMVDVLRQDVRYALRRMRRRPGFTALVALTLALGVGANAAMFDLVDVLLFRTPAHVSDQERVVMVRLAGNSVAYQELQEHLQSLTLTAYTRQTLRAAAAAAAAEHAAVRERGGAGTRARSALSAGRSPAASQVRPRGRRVHRALRSFGQSTSDSTAFRFVRPDAALR